MKNLLKIYWPVLLLFYLSAFIVWPIFLPGYFSHHDDLQVMRIFEMRECFSDLQIPCRWVAEMGYGNGYPLFNYYNVFPYYLGGVVSFFVGFIGGAKSLFLVAAFSAAFAMYFLVKELLESKYAALASAVLYMFAPYRALDIYVRGAIAESFAIAIIPLILYFGLKISKEFNNKNFLGLAFSLTILLTSHTILSTLFLPVILTFFIIIFWGRKGQIIRRVFFSLGLGFGLAAFFVIPAFFERNLVQIDNLTRLDLDFRAHFATLYQLFFDRKWGYGASFPGAGDTISFQIGWPHWPVAVLSLPALIILRKINRRLLLICLSMFVFFVLSVFMTHGRSAFIWEGLGILRFAQFPWRFLSVTIFANSLLAGFLIYSLKGVWGRVVLGVLIIVTVFLNWNYFKPREFYLNLTDKEKLGGELYETQQKASIRDYLPMGAGEPIEPAPSEPIIRSGEADIKSFEKRSNNWRLDLIVSSPSKIEIPVFDFPNWKVYENGEALKYSNDNYVKRISLDLPVGRHLIFAQFTDTPIRTVANTLTGLTMLIVLYLSLYGKSRKFFE